MSDAEGVSFWITAQELTEIPGRCDMPEFEFDYTPQKTHPIHIYDWGDEPELATRFYMRNFVVDGVWYGWGSAGSMVNFKGDSPPPLLSPDTYEWAADSELSKLDAVRGGEQCAYNCPHCEANRRGGGLL